MRATTICVAFVICLFMLLPNSGHATLGYSHLWVRVLDVHYNPITTAQVMARNTANGMYYTLTFQGWGYYNRTLEPGTYDVIVNGRVLKRGVYASAFWYVITTCYI